MLTLVNQMLLGPFFGICANQHSRPLIHMTKTSYAKSRASFNKQKYSLVLCNLLDKCIFWDFIFYTPSIECAL